MTKSADSESAEQGEQVTFDLYFAHRGRDDQVIANRFRRAAHKFDDANNVITWAVFVARPRKRTLTYSQHGLRGQGPRLHEKNTHT